MQPYHPDYFNPRHPRLFSYSKLFWDCARALDGTRASRPPFIHNDLPAPPDAIAPPETISLEDLVRFYRSPAAFFLQSRLGIYLAQPDDQMEDREPLGIAGLDKFKATSDLLVHAIEEKDLNEVKRMMFAKGMLPLGNLGKGHFEVILKEIQPLREAVAQHQQGTPLDPLFVDLVVGSYRLTGEIKNLGTLQRLWYTTAFLNPKHKMECWLYHLALMAVDHPSYPGTSLLIGRQKNGVEIWRLDPFEQGPDYAKEKLLQLAQLYHRGLSRPLPFFPNTSYAYAEALHKASGNETEAQGLKAAKKRWYSAPPYYRGDQDEPYVKCLYGNSDPFTWPEDDPSMRFERLSHLICDPILQWENHGGKRI
jgi:exodeoxyribonuclease V gamma subunit